MDCKLPHSQVVEILCVIHQDSDFHHYGVFGSLLYPSIEGARNLKQQAVAAMGGRCWDKPLQEK